MPKTEKSTPKDNQVEEPAVKKPARKLTRRVRGPSIKDAIAGKLDDDKLTAKEQHEVYTRADEEEDFTFEDLQIKWKEYVDRLADRPNLQSTLSDVPEIEENNRLVLKIANSVQDSLIDQIKPELVSFLRRELKNSKIQLLTRIEETSKEKLIYSDSEKYAEMIKKNPELDLLKQKFNLDFE